MTASKELTNYASMPGDDGWDDCAAEAADRTIRGTLLKFADWHFTAGKEATPVEIGTRLVALGMVAMWQRWEDGKPAQTIKREPGKRLPEREELGFLDQKQWPEGLDGKPTDPWQNVRAIYLVDPVTAEAFTFLTRSWGGRSAVIDLGDQIARMRTVYPDVVPIVELNAGPMKTKFGLKSKPIFKIVGWKTAGGAEPAPIESPKLISPQVAKQELYEKEMDDEVPF